MSEPRKKLTKSYIDTIPTPNKPQVDYFDSELKGFGLRVGATKKIFFVMARVNGRLTRVTIGKYGILTPEQARKDAKLVLGQMHKGVDPNKEKASKQARSITLAKAYEEYQKIRKPKEITVYTDKCLMGHLSDWQDKPIAEITKDMVEKRHRSISEGVGKHAANNTFRMFRRVYNCINSRLDDSLPQNPVSRLSATKQWEKVGRRQTIIPDSDLPSWYRAVRSIDNPFMRNYLIILLFTGMRKNEGLSIEWTNVNMVDKTITLPETKNGKPHIIPMSNYLFGLFSELQAIRQNEYVFPAFVTDGKTGHMTEPKRQVQKVKGKTKIEFCLHDLRRVFKTVAQDTVTKAESDRLTNHSSRDAGDGYIILSTEKVREPMQRITDKLLCLTHAWSDITNYH